MLLNLSNHPLTKWSPMQVEAAQRLYSSIEDMPFPPINPRATVEEIEPLVTKYLALCLQKLQSGDDERSAIHIMGEYTFTYHFVKVMESVRGIDCIASTTERIVTENPDGSKTTIFEFVQFRSYFQGK